LQAGMERASEYASSGMQWGGELALSYAAALSEFSRLRQQTRQIPLSRLLRS